MNILFFDTETTGLAHNTLPATHPKQPVPMQIAFIMDKDGETISYSNLLVRPEGRWVPSPKAVEVHGKTPEMCDQFGVDIRVAVDVFCDMIQAADRVVAHNAKYDVTVMRRAEAIAAEIDGRKYEDPFIEINKIMCTMLAATDHVRALPRRNGDWKWPNLNECSQFFFQRDILNAHDAMADVQACREIYYEMVNRGIIDETQQNK